VRLDAEFREEAVQPFRVVRFVRDEMTRARGSGRKYACVADVVPRHDVDCCG
jgi:hypothetical protein